MTRLLIAHRRIKPVDAHDFVAARIDYLHRNTLVPTSWKGQRDSAAQRGETIFVNYALECAGELFPGRFIRKERLGDAEGLTVVVTVNEPSGDLLGTGGQQGIVDWIVDVDALHLDYILAVVHMA